MKFFNTRGKRDFLRNIRDKYNTDFRLEGELYRKEGSVYLITGDYSGLSEDEAEAEGLKLFDNSGMTVEGSNLIKPGKGILEIEDYQLNLFLQGKTSEIEKKQMEKYNIRKDDECVVKFKDDFFGSAKIRNGKLLSNIPFKRRLKTDFV